MDESTDQAQVLRYVLGVHRGGIAMLVAGLCVHHAYVL